MAATMRGAVRLILAVIAGAYAGAANFELSSQPCADPYSEFAIVVDGGSTGSRLFVFNVTYSDGPVVVSSMQGPKAKPGLSTFVGEITETRVTTYLMSLFSEARKLIPQPFQKATRVYIKATAGMRLTCEENQQRTYDQIYEGLTAHPDFAFHLEREDVGTISGDSEGHYAALSVNYLAGRVAGDLSDTGGLSQLGPLGALDMGGGSSQIVFEPPQPKSAAKTRGEPEGGRLSVDRFWGHSYLGYGVDQIRIKLWSYLVTEHKAQARRLIRAAKLEEEKEEEDEDEDEAPRKKEEEGAPLVHNPCGFRGQVQHWEAVDLQGTGDAAECAILLRRIVFGPECELEPHDMESLGGPITVDPAVEGPAVVGGLAKHKRHTPAPGAPEVVRPPCPMDDRVPPQTKGVEFYAMSVYFYALHGAFTMVREALDASGKGDADVEAALARWPQPSLRDLRTVVGAFCGVDWPSLTDLPKHRYTARDQLSHRCVEVNWIVELLGSGFGIPEDARSVTFALEVADMEVEWTLGFVLSSVSKMDKVRSCRVGDAYNVSEEDNATSVAPELTSLAQAAAVVSEALT